VTGRVVTGRGGGSRPAGVLAAMMSTVFPAWMWACISGKLASSASGCSLVVWHDPPFRIRRAMAPCPFVRVHVREPRYVQTRARVADADDGSRS
jgi:hypothetical protein